MAMPNHGTYKITIKEDGSILSESFEVAYKFDGMSGITRNEEKMVRDELTSIRNSLLNSIADIRKERFEEYKSRQQDFRNDRPVTRYTMAVEEETKQRMEKLAEQDEQKRKEAKKGVSTVKEAVGETFQEAMKFMAPGKVMITPNQMKSIHNLYKAPMNDKIDYLMKEKFNKKAVNELTQEEASEIIQVCTEFLRKKQEERESKEKQII